MAEKPSDLKANRKNNIKSFVLRQGRFTINRQNKFYTLYPIFGIEYTKRLLDFKEIFKRDSKVICEIGFGVGDSLIHQAKTFPDVNFIGIEVYKPGITSCMKIADELSLTNLKLICHDAVLVLENMIPYNSLDAIQLYFPDPWPKKRHNKRRILQEYFVNLIRFRLKIGGVFHMATDFKPYALHSLEILERCSDLVNLSTSNDGFVNKGTRPITKFEKRGHKLGYKSWDIKYLRVL